MKKAILIILSILLVAAISVWFSCNPFQQNVKGASSNFSELDESNSRLVITSCIEVNGTTWDGGGMTIDPSGYYSLQQDAIVYVFKVTNGTVKNVTISPYSLDGIAISGNCTVTNINIPNTNRRALTVIGTGTSTVSYITGNNVEDKLFQTNDLCTITFSNIFSNGLTRMVRQNGGKTWKMVCYIDSANLTGLTEAVVRSDSTTTSVYWRNITCNLPQADWWYGTASGVYDFKVFTY